MDITNKHRSKMAMNNDTISLQFLRQNNTVLNIQHISVLSENTKTLIIYYWI